jgi:hypothetical protein
MMPHLPARHLCAVMRGGNIFINNGGLTYAY